MIKSQVTNCNACGAWLSRLPPYYGTGDKGDYCQKCFCTSVKVRDGRPFGPRHRDWKWMLKEVMELVELFEEDSFEYRDVLDSLVVQS